MNATQMQLTAGVPDEQLLIGEIRRVILDWKRRGFDKAAICSQSAEIEAEAVANVQRVARLS